MTAIFRLEGPPVSRYRARGRPLVAGDAAGQRDHRADDARAFAEVLQAMTFERRAAQVQAS
ncbi:hypothetical protein V1283_001129 [Bradyrhizobium sp. AZCC 2262]|uniref:hypothetical protein n=1 Tax=Bradyrhizobium sp. AZCC 2262 TaxID=3117022 RepID=UPI002FEF9088